MKFYLAPLEGITGYVYRNVYQRQMGHVDKYFSPFISTTQKKMLRAKELNDILPAHNEGMKLVPQLLSNHADDFLFFAEEIFGLGYETVNLNLGCPSRTVVSKGKGSGFLEKTVALDRFLGQVYRDCPAKISIKTRLGKDDPEEFYELIQIFNQYPVEELVIHPRVQQDYYKNKPDWEMFGEALSRCQMPVCYNGDLFTVADYHRFAETFPQVERVMLGRGILTNPNLVAECRGESAGVTKEQVQAFIEDLYQSYRKVLFGDTAVLFKMKEIWSFLIQSFEGGDSFRKRIHKCQKLVDYERIQKELFDTLRIVE